MNHKQNYVKFDEDDLETFLKLMDVESQGIITLGDIEVTCSTLGLAHNYENVKKLFQSMLHVSQGGLVIEEVKKFLMESEKTSEEEIADIFDYIDYDKQG